MSMNAQISFLDGTFTLIHIPLSLYSSFLQPILQVLLPPGHGLIDSPQLQDLAPEDQHGFLNISVTPIECSVVCHSSWAQAVFIPAINRLAKDQAKTVLVSKDTYVVFSVISTGMDAGSRVVDLTSPLALAGIPIFFITTYYSDFILVPVKDRQAVVQTLLARGFVFSEEQSSFTTTMPPTHSRGPSQSSDPPSTPPPSSDGELQERTFLQLKKRSVVPYVEPGLLLCQCSGPGKSVAQHPYAGHRSSMRSNGGNPQGWVNTVDSKLYLGAVAALTAQPRFLSITLAQEDPPSLLLDKSLLPIFGDALVGDTNGKLVPIFLNLTDLPFEATGIVSGVAGKLVQEMHTSESAELSYLSTARAGAVILSSEQSKKALGILQPLLSDSESERSFSTAREAW